MFKTKKTIIAALVSLLIAAMLACCLTGCREADRASYNVSKQADNFNIVRQVTVIDCINGDVMFQMTGKMSVYADTEDNQLEIVVEDSGTYTKHIIGLSDNVTYVVEDLNLGSNDVSKYHYTINFNPKMWVPVDAENID